MDARPFTLVLTGFSFVGAYPCPGLSLPAHGVAALAFPVRFRTGACHVFHRTAAPSHELALMLVRRLREVRAEVLRYPKSPSDLVRLYHGGPLFRIDFRYAGRGGSLVIVQGSHDDAPGNEAWAPDDYILLFPD